MPNEQRIFHSKTYHPASLGNLSKSQLWSNPRSRHQTRSHLACHCHQWSWTNTPCIHRQGYRREPATHEPLISVAVHRSEAMCFEGSEKSADLGSHALLHERTEPAFIVDLYQLLRSIGRIGNIELHLDGGARSRRSRGRVHKSRKSKSSIWSFCGNFEVLASVGGWLTSYTLTGDILVWYMYVTCNIISVILRLLWNCPLKNIESQSIKATAQIETTDLHYRAFL